MKRNQHNYVHHRRTWVQMLEAFFFLVLLMLILGGTLYLTFVDL
jgi:hypothetical protein